MVVIDPLELIRAVINLLSNARDASVGRPSCVQLSTDLNTEGFVRLAVRDHGFGMSNEVQARLFQPFFTTKPGRGTGLGLAGVKRMVDAVHGTIRVETVPSEGTTVSLFFPRVAADAARSE
jgi:signal transduction histidine kinase